MIVRNKETGATHEVAPGTRAERRIKGDPRYEEVKPTEPKKPEKSG